MPERYDARRLEQVMRDGLAARVHEAPTRLADPIGGGSRRARHQLAVLAAAGIAAIALGVPVARQVFSDAGGNGPVTEPPASGRTSAAAPNTDSWRVESFAEVQIKVPPSWGWGGAPVGNDACGTMTAFVEPGSDDYESVAPGTPFVGRPAAMTDACHLTSQDPVPEVDAVWLGSPLEVGTLTHENGQVSETFRVGDQHVTVFSHDAELRERIRATATTFDVDDNGCPTEPTDEAVPASEDLKPTSLSVCIYNDPFGEEVLLWSGRRDAAAASAYVRAVNDSSALYDPARFCERAQAGPHVTLGVHGTSQGQSVTRWDYVNFECMQIGSAYFYDGDKVSGSAAPLRDDTVEPWSGGGTLAYVHLPANFPVELKRWFRGPLG